MQEYDIIVLGTDLKVSIPPPPSSSLSSSFVKSLYSI